MDKFMIGIIIGWLSLWGVFFLWPIGVGHMYYDAIDECEKALPQEQRCIINAIPDVPKDAP